MAQTEMMPEELPRGGRNPAVGIIAIAVVAVFGAAIWFAYDQGIKRNVDLVPPLIRAPDSPAKVSPEGPDTTAVPNQDKAVFETLIARPASGGQIKFREPPEAPTPGIGSPTGTEVPAAETVEPIAEPPADPPQVPLTSVPKPQPAKPAVTVQPAKPPSPAVKPPATVRPDTKRTVARGGRELFTVQIGSFGSANAARAGWRQFRAKHAAALGGLAERIVKIDLKNRGTFYRLQAGGFATRADAGTVCRRLKSRGLGCLVVER